MFFRIVWITNEGKLKSTAAEIQKLLGESLLKNVTR